MPRGLAEAADIENPRPSFRDGAPAPDPQSEIPGSMLRIAPE
jgi:hypothetical protein